MSLGTCQQHWAAVKSLEQHSECLRGEQTGTEAMVVDVESFDEMQDGEWAEEGRKDFIKGESLWRKGLEERAE